MLAPPKGAVDRFWKEALTVPGLLLQPSTLSTLHSHHAAYKAETMSCSSQSCKQATKHTALQPANVYTVHTQHCFCGHIRLLYWNCYKLRGDGPCASVRHVISQGVRPAVILTPIHAKSAAATKIHGRTKNCLHQRFTGRSKPSPPTELGREVPKGFHRAFEKQPAQPKIIE